MKSRAIIVPLFAAILANGCASPDPRPGAYDPQYLAGQATPNYYAVIDSIEARSPGDDSAAADAYAIRVRFDDRTYQTVTQAGLDGLRVGDSVRIENHRVRRY